MANDQRFDETLKYLQEMFPGKLLLAIEDVSSTLGISTRTIYNKTGKRARIKFPIKPVRTGNLLKFRIHDLARYISEL